jgi:TDG/mug DNA glycosylase family protein
VPRLRDILVSEPRILFVGINPYLRSAALGHHFAGPGNPFWRLLAAAGLVPDSLTFVNDRTIGQWGLALTNLCPRPTRAADELDAAEIAAGCRTLKRKIERLRPEVVAFVGVTLYQQFFRLPRSGGAGEKPETIAGARVFVVPNPSGLNASFPGFAHKLPWYERLRAYALGDTVTRWPAASPPPSPSPAPLAARTPRPRARPPKR